MQTMLFKSSINNTGKAFQSYRIMQGASLIHTKFEKVHAFLNLLSEFF